MDWTRVKVVGYGHTTSNGAISNSLKMGTMVYRKFDWCYSEEQYLITKGPDYNESKLLCTVSTNWPNTETDTCSGDSGGPIFKRSNDSNLYQFALTSFATSKCGTQSSIAWNVRVIYFKREINRLMAGKWAPWYSISGNQYESPGKL